MKNGLSIYFGAKTASFSEEFIKQLNNNHLFSTEGYAELKM